MTLKDMQEKLGKLGAEIKSLADKSNDSEEKFSDEDQKRWDKVNKEYDDLKIQAEKAQRAEDVQAEMNEVVTPDGVTKEELASPEYAEHQKRENPEAINEEDRALALQSWFQRQMGYKLDDKHQEACDKTGFDANQRNLDIRAFNTQQVNNLREKRTTTYNSTESGYGDDLVPQGFVNNYEFALQAFGGVRNVATILRTAKGNAMPWPYTDDTNVGELVSEYADSDDSGASDDNITTSNVTFNAYKISSKLIRVSYELIEDSAFNMVNIIGRLCGERVARKLASLLTRGTGSSQHDGIVTAAEAAASGETAASASTITMDELIDLMYSVDPAYRSGAGMNTGWMMNDTVAAIVRKLKDSDNRYLWQPSTQAGEPDMLLGYPVTINQNMDPEAGSIAASDTVALFGAFAKYIVREVGTIRLKHLVERYAELDQEAFVALQRSDGDLLDAGTHPVNYLQLAAS